jgi:hypothetical protein
MSKDQLIAEIRKYNATVELVFLNQFTEVDLQAYLGRLESAHRKQQLIAGWVKPRRPMRIAS